MELDDRSHCLWRVVGYCVREGEATSSAMPAETFDLWVFARDAELE